MTKGTKKSRWLVRTLAVLIVCGLAGTILAAVLYFREGHRTYAEASILFSFEGASEGKGPNGYPLDVNGILSDEVITGALEASGMAEKYTVEQIRENLSVIGVYPEDIVDQMTRYTSLLDAETEQQAALINYHATQYKVTLYRDFDPGLSEKEQKELLSNLLTGYRSYFAKTASPSLTATDAIADLSSYDYAQQLAVIREEARQQGAFAQEMAELAPDFRQGQKGFDDIVVSYNNLDSDIERLNASVTLNVLSKDRERLRKQYEMELRSLGWEMESKQAELKQIEAMMDTYEKDAIVYVSTSNALRKIESSASKTYDKLVECRKELTDSIASANAQITKYQALLADMTQEEKADSGTEATDDTAEETADTSVELTEEDVARLSAEAEKQIEELTGKKNAVIADFVAMLNAYAANEVNERTVSVSSLKYNTPSLLSAVFIVKLLKTAGPLCAVGFIVCLILIICDHKKRTRLLN